MTHPIITPAKREKKTLEDKKQKKTKNKKYQLVRRRSGVLKQIKRTISKGKMRTHPRREAGIMVHGGKNMMNQMEEMWEERN